MNLLPNVAHAADAESAINTIVPKIVENIVSPLVQLVFALAIFMFIWGLIGFFTSGDDLSKRKEGQNHILWGVIGIFIMISVFGIIRLVANTVGQDSVIGF